MRDISPTVYESAQFINQSNTKKMKGMRTVLIAALLVMGCVQVDAQLLTTEELEAYAVKEYGEKWVDAAAKVAEGITLDKNGGLTYTEVIDAPGKTKEQLYILLNYWYSASFNNANAVIKLNDKESGVIIGEGFLYRIASNMGGSNSYSVNIKPLIKCDIKDEKVRVTYTVPCYIVTKISGGGLLGGYKLVKGADTTNQTLDTTYPFVEKDSHKKTSSKALVMSYAYSNVILDKLGTCIQEGLVGNEMDEW